MNIPSKTQSLVRTMLNGVIGNVSTNKTKVVDSVLAGGGAAAAFVALYIFYHYDWLRNRSFTGVGGGFLYRFVPVSISVLLFLSLRLKRAYKLAVACFLGGVLTLAWVGEMLLAHGENVATELPYWGFGPGSEQKRRILMMARQAGVDFDTRHISTVITDLRTLGIDATPFVGTRFMEERPDGSIRSQLEVNHAELIPMGGISDKLTIACNQTGSFTSYKSDERGFNNPRGIWSSRQVKITALGQSFVQGFCAPAGKNFVDLVRKQYPATLNLGFSGEGPLKQLGAINEYLTNLRPEIVLWFYLEGIDLEYLQYERKSQLAMRYMEDGFDQGLISHQSDIDKALTSYSEAELFRGKAAHVEGPPDNKLKTIVDAIKFNRVRSKLGLVYGRQAETLSGLDNANIRLFGDILARANKRVGEWGGKLHLVYLPTWKRFGSRSPLLDQERALINTAARASNVSIVDTLQGFYAQKDPLSLFPFGVFGHYNEAGHRVVAEEVLKAIAASKPDKITSSRSNE